jgi:hypothetical protein
LIGEAAAGDDYHRPRTPTAAQQPIVRGLDTADHY